MISLRCTGTLPAAALSSRATKFRCPCTAGSSLKWSGPSRGISPTSTSTREILRETASRARFDLKEYRSLLQVSLKDDVAASNSESYNAQEEDEASKSGPSQPVVEAEILSINGKSGTVTFYNGPKPGDDDPSWASLRHRSLLWLLGPMILVSSVVIPPYAFRAIFEAVLEDTVVTDFIILFFTELHFYAGVGAFLYVADMFRGPVQPVAAEDVKYTWGYRVTAGITMALSIVLAVACFCLAWKYTGPAAIAALVPYVAGIAVQLLAERYTRNMPAIKPLVPIIFQLYRLHQLNRGAQLVAGLLFSMKGVEASAQTAAINGSLQTLLSTMQLLGIFALWSLASFFMQSTRAWHHGKAISFLPL